MSTKNRNWCFTSYKENLKIENFKYYIVGKEICPTTGKKHLQGFIHFENAITMKGVKERLGDNSAHCEILKGSAEQAIAYCKKEGNFIEKGDKPKQGSRTDLKSIRETYMKQEIPEMIDSGIISSFQQLKFAEGLQKYRNLELREYPEVHWFYGATGTGKTHHVFEKHSLDEIFRIEPNCQWFDGYFGQRVALLDDFRGNIKFSILLQILDKYPLRVNTKGAFTQWRPEIIYITSSKHPEEVYQNVGEDINQLLDRINIRYFEGKSRRSKNDTKVSGPEVGGNTSAPTAS